MNVPMNVPSSRRPLRILTYKFRSRFRRNDSARHSSDAFRLTLSIFLQTSFPA
jgi:hypothetical protein